MVLVFEVLNPLMIGGRPAVSEIWYGALLSKSSSRVEIWGSGVLGGRVLVRWL